MSGQRILQYSQHDPSGSRKRQRESEDQNYRQDSRPRQYTDHDRRCTAARRELQKDHADDVDDNDIDDIGGEDNKEPPRRNRFQRPVAKQPPPSPPLFSSNVRADKFIRCFQRVHRILPVHKPVQPLTVRSYFSSCEGNTGHHMCRMQ